MPFYSRIIRPVFFRFGPETAHHIAIVTLKVMGGIPGLKGVLQRFFRIRDSRLEQYLWGRLFLNPVGFAAGFDKNAEVVVPLSSFGFSHIEVGTLTREAQPGNPKPRAFRLKPDRSLVNRMGINNQGADRITDRLLQEIGPANDLRRPDCLVGVNIGKTTAVPADDAVEDQLACLERVAPVADYLVVNVSCPNVKGLTGFQAADKLRPLLAALRQKLRDIAPGCPLLVKVSPDLDEEGVNGLVDVALECECDGFIATNTTTTRDGLRTPSSEVASYGDGGMSGAALREKSTRVLGQLARRVDRRVPIIGVGGIEDVESAWEKIVHGASLVQVYTGFIYTGPFLVRDINRGLLTRLQKNGFSSLEEAIGSAL